jgi:hypothetical protein
MISAGVTRNGFAATVPADTTRAVLVGDARSTVVELASPSG